MVLVPLNSLTDRQLKDLLVRVQATQPVLTCESLLVAELLAKPQLTIMDRARGAQLVKKYQGKL